MPKALRADFQKGEIKIVSMSRVIFDARSAFPFQQRDGLGTYIVEVVTRIAAEASDLQITVLANPGMVEFWHESAPGATVIPTACRPMWPGQNWQIPRITRRLKADLYFYPVHDPPLLNSTPFVFTIHDLIAHQVRPYFESMDAPKMAYIRALTAVALRRAVAVMTGSEATKTAVGEIFGTRFLKKIHVTPYGGFNEALPVVAPQAGAKSCLMYVGTDRPHKNLNRLIAAYAQALKQHNDLPPLEIIGGLRQEERVREEINRAGLDGRVILRGYVDDEELERTYARASALLFPSLAEGFGLPIIEAMRRGVPVMTSNRSACAEVGADAALLVDPFDVENMALGIVRVTTDSGLREKLVRLGSARVSQFTWDRCAAGTLAAIRQALSSTGKN